MTPTCHIRMLHVLMNISGEGVVQKSVTTLLSALCNGVTKKQMPPQIVLCEEQILPTKIAGQWQ